MGVQKSFTFFSQELNQVSWTLTDQNGNPVNSAAVVATLYWGRDRINPNATPGIAVSQFTAINLTYSSTTNSYVGTIPGLFDEPIGGDYTLVVDAKDGSGSQLGHWERRAVITVSGS
jgi:hypothetical protein